MMRLALTLVLATASLSAGDDGIAPRVGPPAGAHAALVGLLDMPIVYDYADEMPSDDPKPKQRPARLDVRAQPVSGSAVVATLDARGIAVGGVHRCLWRGGRPGTNDCPHWESGYEVPALAVFETRPGGWYRMAVDRNATRFGWLQSDETFRALESLVASEDHLTYLTARWPRTVHDRAGGGTTTLVPRHPPLPGQSGDTTPYRAIRHTHLASELWIEVEVLDAVCGPNDPRVIATGWTPARTAGALVVWYHSRGC